MRQRSRGLTHGRPLLDVPLSRTGHVIPLSLSLSPPFLSLPFFSLSPTFLSLSPFFSLSLSSLFLEDRSTIPAPAFYVCLSLSLSLLYPFLTLPFFLSFFLSSPVSFFSLWPHGHVIQHGSLPLIGWAGKLIGD